MDFKFVINNIPCLMCWYTRILQILLLILVSSTIIVDSLPDGFVAEVVTNAPAVSGIFAPNPRNDDKPMLMLVSKRGLVSVVENPDESPDSIEILDLGTGNRLCTNGERGLQSITIHPNFTDNLFVYLFYTRYSQGCPADSEDGEMWNVVERFVMNSSTLQLDYDTREPIWRTSPLAWRIHNGGALAFGNDGKLWITTGDSGNRDMVPLLNNTHGSIIRLNDDGSLPEDNPSRQDNNETHVFRCADTGGVVPIDAPENSVCGEVFANGVRNPFRIAMDPKEKDKVKFAMSDVGANHWEEISIAGTDYKGKNYGWPAWEGPCSRNSLTDCPLPPDNDSTIIEPFHYYEHRSLQEGGCVGGSTFVPEGIWPSKYQFLFIDFIFLEIYNLIEEPERECRTSCWPPMSRYRNETFFESVHDPTIHVNNARMTDMFFGPYNGTEALYVTFFGTFDTVLRIRYTGIVNDPPLVDFEVEDRNFDVGEAIFFNGSISSDPDGDNITFSWRFGDGTKSDEQNPTHRYDAIGEYIVTLIVKDSIGHTNQKSAKIVVGDPPQVSILSPFENDTFVVGENIWLEANASDWYGNPLNNSVFEWEVRRHHAKHFHPFLEPTEGNGFYLESAPEPEDFYAAMNSHLEVIVKVTDENGLTATTNRLVYPDMMLVGIDSVPSNLIILVDGEKVESFQEIWSWTGHKLHLIASKDNYPLVFESWGDGTTERERFSALDSNHSYFVATFCTAIGGECNLNETNCCHGTCDNSSGVCLDYAAPPVTWTALDYTTAFEMSSSKYGGCNPRDDGVDMQPTTDMICQLRDQSPCNIGWWEAGEYLMYHFTIPQGEAGLYNIRARVATNAAGKDLGIAILPHGGDWESESFVVPADGYQSFNDINWKVRLEENNYDLKIFSTLGSINLCSVSLFPTNTSEPRNKTTVPVTWSALDYSFAFEKTEDSYGGCNTQSDGVDAQLTSDDICQVRDGSLCNVGWWDADEYLLYSFSVPSQSAGMYNIRVRAAAHALGKDIGLQLLQAADDIVLDSKLFSVPAEGYQSFNDLIWNVFLEEGDYDLKVHSNTGKINLCSVAILEADEEEIFKMTVPGIYNAMSFTDDFVEKSIERYGDCPVRSDSHIDAKLNQDSVCKQAVSEFDEHCNIAWSEPDEYVVYDIYKESTQTNVKVSIRIASYKSKSVKVQLYSFDMLTEFGSTTIKTPGRQSWNIYDTIVVWEDIALEVSNRSR